MKHNIYFDEATHKYTDDFGNPFTSVTTIIHKYQAQFDTDAMAYRCFKSGLKGNPKYAGKSVKQIKAEWKLRNTTSLIQGNKDHDYLESAVKESSNYYKIERKLKHKQIYTIEDVLEDETIGVLDLKSPKMLEIKKNFPMIYLTFEILKENGFRILSEVGVFNLKYGVSGLIDILAVKEDEFKIVDWKTNNDTIVFNAGYWIHDENYNVTGYKNTYQTLREPITNLDDSVGNLYALQLSTYAALLEDIGMKNTGMLLYHIRKFLYSDEHEDVQLNPACKDTRQLDTIKMPYLKDEVLRVLTHHSLAQQKTESGTLKFGLMNR